MTTTLEQMGARVSELSTSAPMASTDAILAGAYRKRRARARRTQMVGASIAMLAITLLSVVGMRTWWIHRAPPEASVLSGGVPSAAVASASSSPTPPTGSTVPLAFEDGTRIVLQRGTRAEVLEVKKHGAVIALNDGTLDVDVVHTDDSAWDVRAGGFGIHVTGTKFLATFDPRTNKLTVAMREGTVIVSSACMKDEPLSAPMEKTFACDSAPVPLTTTATTTHASKGKAAPPPPLKARAAEVEPVVETADTIFARADHARLSGDRSEAAKLYQKIRDTFPRTEAAAKAAFLLGRMASSDDESVRWFEVVLREAPNAFAQEALGRLVEIEQNRGNRDRATTLAKDYLKKHPKGPHAAYATSVLSQ